MPIDDGPFPNKRSCYTSDPLPAAIYVSYRKSAIRLTPPCESPKAILLTPDDSKTGHTIMGDKHYSGSVKIGYCARRHDGERCKKKGYIDPCVI